MKGPLLICVALAVAAASGWAHGILIDRWGIPADVKAIAAQTESLVIDIDGWTREEGKELDEHTRKLSGADGYFSCSYLSDDSPATVYVTILCGRSGPISLHSPNVCFTLSGMRQHNEEQHMQLLPLGEDPGQKEQTSPDQQTADFWMADYTPAPSQGGADIKTFWAWSRDGQTWSTPENPRFTFASSPYLYRLYFTAPRNQFDDVIPADDAADDGAAPSVNPTREFMAKFLKRFAEVTQESAADKTAQQQSQDPSEES